MDLRLEGFEPPTYRTGTCHSNPLNYRRTSKYINTEHTQNPSGGLHSS